MFLFRLQRRRSIGMPFSRSGRAYSRVDTRKPTACQPSKSSGESSFLAASVTSELRFYDGRAGSFDAIGQKSPSLRNVLQKRATEKSRFVICIVVARPIRWPTSCGPFIMRRFLQGIESEFESACMMLRPGRKTPLRQNLFFRVRLEPCASSLRLDSQAGLGAIQWIRHGFAPFTSRTLVEESLDGVTKNPAVFVG